MKRLTLRVPDDIHKLIREKSFSIGKSMNGIIIALLEKGLKQDRIEFERKQKEKNEQMKEILKTYKDGNKNKAKKMYHELTGDNLPEWLFDVLET